MLTLAVTINRLNTKNKKSNKWQQGFSIIEVLVAIGLIALVFSIIPLGLTDTERQKIEAVMSKLNRAIRFSVDESVLRNSIVRIKFELDKDPAEYYIEYGEGSNIVLPQAKDLSNLSLRDREIFLQKAKKLDGQFTKVEEYRDSNEVLPEGIYIYGVGTTYNPRVITEGDAYIYFYPTGEKDNVILIFTGAQELATLKVFPFEERTEETFITFTENELANLEYTLENKTKDLFERWLKE